MGALMKFIDENLEIRGCGCGKKNIKSLSLALKNRW